MLDTVHYDDTVIESIQCNFRIFRNFFASLLAISVMVPVPPGAYQADPATEITFKLSQISFLFDFHQTRKKKWLCGGSKQQGLVPTSTSTATGIFEEERSYYTRKRIT